MPSVSVIIPAYNAASTVARAIGSALFQTQAPLEVIVIDDGSSDDTAVVAEDFGDKVRCIRKPNGGPASARNLGAREARGDWLAMLDADDWWAPSKLKKQVSLDTSAQIGLIFTPISISPMHVLGELDFNDLWARNWIGNSSTLIRRSVFEKLGGFIEDPELISVEDYNLWLRISAGGWRLLSYPELLCHYTRGVGLSSQRERFLKATLYNIELCGRILGLSQEAVDWKREETYRQFGWSAIYDRKLPLARSLMRNAAAIKPSRSSAIGLMVASLPPQILEARRHWFGSPARVRRDAALAPESAIFGPKDGVDLVNFDSSVPYLLAVIDAEEEFDWSIAPSPSLSIKSIRSQDVAQRIFDRFRVVPTYAVDYAVASQSEGYKPLREYMTDGRCEIGAQLHPWVNPPIDEAQREENTFPGNLPARLEFEKLRVLTDIISQNFEIKPTLYRAGRYGAGPNTAMALHELGYKVDCSVLPFHDLRFKHGPDYSHSPAELYWFGPRNSILEMPSTVGMTGLASLLGRQLYPVIATRLGQALHAPGVFARLHLLDRIRLTPQGTSLAEAKRLTRAMVKRGHCVFVLSYHSPSLEPGNTPYVRSAKDLSQFLGWLEAYLEFFFGEIGGVAATPSFVYEEAAAACNPARLVHLQRPSLAPVGT